MTTEATDPKPGFFSRNKIWLIAILLFIVSNAGIYFYQKYEQDKMLDTVYETLYQKGISAEESALARNEEVATGLCRTLTWGIRGEMERGNKEVIELFLNKLVQESGVDLVIIQNAQDSIYLSTNKKYENRKIPYIQGVVAQQKVLKSDMEEIVVAAPIMGMESRLGTCLLVYKMMPQTLQKLEEMRRIELPGIPLEATN